MPSSSSISVGDQDDAVRNQRNQKEEEEERFLVELKSLGCDPYLYKKEWFYDEINGCFKCPGAQLFFKSSAKRFDRVQKLGFPFIKPMDLGTVKHYSYSDLEEITRSFSGRNCKTRHGRLFEGKINSQDVIVKTWDFSFYALEWCPSHADRFIDELTFLRDPNIKSRPSTVNLIGYHCDQNLAVVYEGIWPEQCLNDILTFDEFKWEDRMKVAIDIGSMLKIFHDNNHVHGGIESPYVMLDKKFRSKIFEFRLYSYSEDIAREYLPYRLMDSAADLTGEEEKDPDKWSMIDDVFTYGILLMELITKQCLTYYLTEIWVRDWIYEHPKSVVHESLDVDEETASKITKLAFDCLKVKQNSKKKNVEVVDIGKVVQDLEMTLS